jgi:ABC-type transport system involved in multi-copper enzyme maturation permease subunit
MRTLILKDIRQTLWPLIFCWVVFFAPVTIFAIDYYTSNRQPPAWGDMRNAIAGLFLYDGVATLLAASSITGVAFARERRERTMEFLTILPISRSKIVASKGLVALMLLAAPLLVGAALALALAGSTETARFWKEMWTADNAVAVVYVSMVYLALAGLGWLGSAILRTEVLASALPLLIVLGTIAFLAFVVTNGGRHTETEWSNDMIHALLWTLGSMGIGGFFFGTVIALRRQSP